MAIPLLFWILYIVVNVAVLLVYGADKRKAEKDLWRIPERTLVLAALFGPFGAAAGMNIFRHKTRKPKFHLVYVFCILHAVLLILLMTV